MADGLSAALRGPPLDLAGITTTPEDKLTDWRGLLRRQVTQGQQILKKLLVERISFLPK
jgi:hypothetical protein